MNMILVLSFILIITIFVIAVVCLFYFTKKHHPKTPKPSNEEIEILIYQDEMPNKEASKEIPHETVSDDTLNLDDLFKTMSIHVLKDDPDFDFGLRRTQNVKKH